MRVSTESHIICGACYQCRIGDTHVCADDKIIGISEDGCFAEVVKLPARAVWPTNLDKITLSPRWPPCVEPFGDAVHACTKVSTCAASAWPSSAAGPSASSPWPSPGPWAPTTSSASSRMEKPRRDGPPPRRRRGPPPQAPPRQDLPPQRPRADRPDPQAHRRRRRRRGAGDDRHQLQRQQRHPRGAPRRRRDPLRPQDRGRGHPGLRPAHRRRHQPAQRDRPAHLRDVAHHPAPAGVARPQHPRSHLGGDPQPRRGHDVRLPASTTWPASRRPSPPTPRWSSATDHSAVTAAHPAGAGVGNPAASRVAAA